MKIELKNKIIYDNEQVIKELENEKEKICR
jgi:hypothetical protein